MGVIASTDCFLELEREAVAPVTSSSIEKISSKDGCVLTLRCGRTDGPGEGRSGALMRTLEAFGEILDSFLLLADLTSGVGKSSVANQSRCFSIATLS